jgi:hypothetical protein
MKKFERERIQILDSKKMKQNPKSFLNNLFKIIGVEKKSISERIDRHRSGNKRRPSWVERVVPGRSLPERGIRLLARMALPEELTKGDPIKNVTLNDRVTRKVKNEIEEDVSEFRKISKRNFEHWSV